MISFVNATGSVKIRLAFSKALLLTISSSNIVTHSNGYIKGEKYFLSYKSRCCKSSPETKLLAVFTLSQHNFFAYINKKYICSLA